jgi:hypothetical protein
MILAADLIRGMNKVLLDGGSCPSVQSTGKHGLIEVCEYPGSSWKGHDDVAWAFLLMRIISSANLGREAEIRQYA